MIGFVFLIFGFITVVSQTAFIREMLVLFGGNELSIGILFAEWLLGSAAGSYAATLIPGRESHHQKAVSFLSLGLSVFLFFALTALNSIQGFLNLLPGQIISLPLACMVSFIILFPVGFLIGAQYTYGVQWAVDLKIHAAPAKIYLWESLGFLIGGILYTFVFQTLTNSFEILFSLSLLGGFIALILYSSRLMRLIPGFLIILILIASFPFIASWVERMTAEKLYTGYRIQAINNSPYGQIAVLERDQETYLMYNGIPISSYPHQAIERIEKFSYLPLLFHSKPINILVIGGAGSITSTLAQNPEFNIDYVEQDPWLLQFVERYEFPEQPKNNHLKIIRHDGRKFLENNPKEYDLIYLAVPYPTTISLNRFFTHEFFLSIKDHLSTDGLFVLALPGSSSYLSPNLCSLNIDILNALKKTFDFVKIIPDDENLFIASRSSLKTDFTELKKRFEAWPIKTEFLSPDYLVYQLDPKKETWFFNEIEKNLPKDKKPNLFLDFSKTYVNSDNYPRAVQSSLVYSQSISSPRTAVIYKTFCRFSWLIWLCIIIWLLSGQAGVLGTTFSSGAAGMGLQIIGIVALQIKAGNIYSWIGLLSALFMAGLSLGTWLATQTHRLTVRKVEILFFAWIMTWLFIFGLHLAALPLLLVFSAGSGFFLGVEFPLLVTAKQLLDPKTKRAAGKIYAMDLMGGCIAALWISSVLIPSQGIISVLLVLALLKWITLQWWMKHP